MSKVFTQNNQSFTCISCGKYVEKHPSSSRDHCTHCLTGLHVDINPGDRLNTCRGILKPVGLKVSSSKSQIVYSCEKCLNQIFCIVAPDDNNDRIVELSKLIWKD